VYCVLAAHAVTMGEFLQTTMLVVKESLKQVEFLTLSVRIRSVELNVERTERRKLCRQNAYTRLGSVRRTGKSPPCKISANGIAIYTILL
jgi:prophage tail gpP-like protein